MPRLESLTDQPATSPSSPRWRYLLSAPAGGAYNMALDEALMQRARTSGEWTLRVYAWSTPTLSLGRNQSTAGAYDRRTLAERGIDVVRRPTGGRALLHHREVTYSVTAPLVNAGDLRESYGRINRLLLAAVRTLGVDASLVERTGREISPGLTPCFDHPSTGELVVGARKLVGSAQWRHEGALLQHGSILVEDDQSMVASLMTTDVARPHHRPPEPATLRAALGRTPALDEVAAVLFSTLEHESADVAPLDANDAQDLAELASALQTRYLEDSWTWRR